MSTSLTVPWTPDVLLAGVRRRRLFAWVVDMILVGIVSLVVLLALVAMGFLTFGLTWAMLGWIPAIPILYNWFWVASGASGTPGQRLAGLIVRRDDDLGQPGVLQAAVWALGYALTIAAGAVWFAACLVTTRKRCLHDLVAGLVVVRRHPQPAYPFPT
ncbi:MAG: RDD family protein [Rhodospirillales bacterium]|nr:RDD family protein [Rhodospirillales bacterium]